MATQDNKSSASGKAPSSKAPSSKKAAGKKPATRKVATPFETADPTGPAVRVTSEPAPPIDLAKSQGYARTGTGRLSHKTREERVADGLMARSRVAPRELGNFSPSADRTNPVDLILSQESTRLTPLLALRHARMAASPFAFYRGTALLMAQDLGSQASPLIAAQIGGDAHMSNFGFYAADDRRLVFDMNDFDETRPGPFEWDIKRYAASVLLAARANNIPADLAERAVLIFARRYMWWIREFASKPTLEVWYDRLDVQNWVEGLANASLDEIDLCSLVRDGQIPMDDADTTLPCHGDGHVALGNCVHSRTYQRNVQRKTTCQPCPDTDVARKYVRCTRR